MRCRACVSQIRRIAIKQRAVEYRGGSCEHCGWNRNNAALHFHHVNPSEKEFNIGNSKVTEGNIESNAGLKAIT